MTHNLPTPTDNQRVQLLEDVATALSQGTAIEGRIRSAIRCAVPGFADLGCTLVHREEDAEDWIEVIQDDAQEEIRIHNLVRPLLPAILRLAADDLRNGRQFRWIPNVTPTTTRFLHREPPVEQLLQHLDVQSLLAVPLRAGGTTHGGLVFARTAPGAPFHAADLAAAQVIARRVAAAVQTAELHGRHQDEQRHRTRLEDALQKWIQVFEHAGWGAAIVDSQDYRIEAVNPAFARLHGYSSADILVGRLYTDLLPPNGVGELTGWLKREQPPSYETAHVRADGAQFPVLTNVTPLTTESGAVSYVVTVQDLTDLKRTEERLRRSQGLEAVGRLAGGVAHEVNNMMTIILGFSDLLTRSGAVAVERHRDIEEIRKAATRAGRITQQLLAFSRQQILQPADLRINDVVAELIPVLRLLLPANIELESSLAPIGPLVHADRAQLDQVIINLAFNARDAMPGGGALRLVTDSRRLSEEDGRRHIGIPIPTGQYALISVIDTGHGMDPATLQQVFEPFFTTKPVGSGTGLGLATVYGIVKQSGGYVWAESSLGVGTTVTVCLPEAQPKTQVQTSAETEVAATGCRSGTVLVIEDEEGVRELAHRVLQEQGHRILEARDGEDALTILEEFSGELDLVLSDVIVPGISTSELDRRMHELRPDLPVLYMSGYSRDDVVARGLIDAGRPFLQKPFNADELTELVCRELGTEMGSDGRPVTT